VIRTLFLSLLLAGLAHAQTLEQAQDAFRAGDYAQSVRLAEQIAEAQPPSAEAHFLLARIYTETPLADRDKAAAAIQRAQELDPGNVAYLAAELVHLRVDRATYIQEVVTENERIELANKILERDPDNALAHEELGAVAIRDFWRYRNALMFPKLAYENGIEQIDAGDPTLLTADEEGLIPTEQSRAGDPFAGSFSPNDVFIADRFDLDAIEAQGVPAIRYTERAARAYARAVGHLDAALASDPRRQGVYDQLMRVYAIQGDWGAALERLSTMYVHFADDPQTWFYLGLTHHRLGNGEAADRAFARALELAEPDVASAYRSISLLLKDSEEGLAESDDERLIQQFWASEDPLFLTPYNERRLEHYARITLADLLYAAPRVDLRGWQTQRGQIVIRYGAPPSEVTLISQPVAFADRLRRLFNAPTQTAGEGNPFGTASATRDTDRGQNDVRQRAAGLLNTFQIWDYGDFRFVFEDPFRNGEFRLYSPSAQEIEQGVDPWRNDYTILARETIRETPERYAYEPPGPRFDLPYRTATFRGPGGSTDLYVAFGLNVPRFDGGAGQIDVTAGVGLFLVSEGRDLVAERRETLYGLPASQVVRFEEANLWVGAQAIQAPSGPHELSLELQTENPRAVAVRQEDLTLPSYAGAELMLSDVLLAYNVEEAWGGAPAPGEIERDGLRIRPAPWRVFRRSDPLYLYFEAYNLTPAADGVARYEVEIDLAPKREGGGLVGAIRRRLGGTPEGGVSVRFPAEVEGETASTYQILDIDDRDPGPYTLTLRVRDTVTGERQTRTQDIVLE
jgi:GWxTD domain-containing protein